jgi:integrase
MASRIKVTLEHHLNRRYHVIPHGPGRRPVISYGSFNLRYRDPQRLGKRTRLPLEANNVTAALDARRSKEAELNATPAVERKRMLQTVADKYLAEIKAGRKKKTHQAYDVALRYFFEAVGNKSLEKIRRTDLLDFRVYLRDTKAQEPCSEWNKFSNVMGFLKRHGIKGAELGITAHDWPQYTEEEPEIYEQEELDRFFDACNEDERLIYEFFLMTGFREQEVIYATDRCVSFTNGTVSVRHNPNHCWTPKMYKERTVPVLPSLMMKLKARGTTNGLLFPDRQRRAAVSLLGNG